MSTSTDGRPDKERRDWRGKLTVGVILALAGALALIKLVQELRVEPLLRERMDEIRRELSSGPAARLAREDPRGLKQHLSGKSLTSDFDYYRDRAIPLLEEAFRAEEPGAPARTAWIVLLLLIDSPRSRPFFVEVLPSLREPELQKEAQAYLARHPPKG